MAKHAGWLKGMMSLVVVCGVFASAARAEDVVTASGGDIEAVVSTSRDWSLELNATMLGSYNENRFESDKLKANGNLSDIGLDLAARRRLSPEFSTGLRISVYSRIDSDRSIAYGSTETGAYLHPMMWTMRYERGDFLGQSFFTPWAEVEAGISLVTLRGEYLDGTQSLTARLVRPAARGSLGFEVRPWTGSRLFASARASYLAVSEFSNSEIGIGTGVSF